MQLKKICSKDTGLWHEENISNSSFNKKNLCVILQCPIRNHVYFDLRTVRGHYVARINGNIDRTFCSVAPLCNPRVK